MLIDDIHIYIYRALSLERTRRVFSSPFPSVYSRRTDLSFSERPSLGKFDCFRNLSRYVAIPRCLCVCVSFFFLSTCFIDRLSRSEFTILFEISSSFRSRKKEEFSSIELSPSFTRLYWLNYQSGERSSISIKIFHHDVQSIRAFDKRNYTESRKLHAKLAVKCRIITVKRSVKTQPKNSNAKRHPKKHCRNKFPSNCVD